jgi:hypothetical protein
VKYKLLFIAMAVVFILSSGATLAFSQDSQIDLNALIQETQKRSDKPGEMTFIWWIPEEYWQASLAQNPNMTATQIEDFVKVFRPYTIIAVVDGTIGSYGKVEYKAETDIRGNLAFMDGKGNKYLPLTEEEINADTKSFLTMMKPMLTNALGPLGENMHFFIFPARGQDGQETAAAKKEGTFLIKLGEREFRWKLPLGSLLPPKICPTCHEELNGAYKYCPWDGTQLP